MSNSAQDRLSSINRTSRNYIEVKNRALQIRELFRRQNIQFHSTSTIGALLTDAEALSDSNPASKFGATEYQMLWNATHLDRLADALLLLEGEPNCNVYLNKLTSNSLDFLKRGTSHAKDIFWEIDLWAILKRKSNNVRLIDPPDIILDTPDGPLAIACKKIYSRKNVAHQLSSAVKQLEQFDGIGIAAINIDDLVPEESILRSRTSAEMVQFMDAENIRFISTCRQPIRKYFESGRFSAVAISTSLLAEVTHDGTRFNNSRQMTIWAWPNVSKIVSSRLEFFAKVLGVEIEYQPSHADNV